jgi:hypothetical protein
LAKEITAGGRMAIPFLAWRGVSSGLKICPGNPIGCFDFNGGSATVGDSNRITLTGENKSDGGRNGVFVSSRKLT